MVIGAYIVTSYFIFVEKNPERDKEQIFGVMEEVLSALIKEVEQGEQNKESSDSSMKTNHHQELGTNVDFRLAGMLDGKSATFIQKFDTAMDDVRLSYK